MRSRPDSLVPGITLIAAGAIVLCEQAGMPLAAHLWKLWPLVPLVLGLLALRRRAHGQEARLSSTERALLVLTVIPGLLLTLSRDGDSRPRKPPRPPRTPSAGELPLPPDEESLPALPDVPLLPLSAEPFALPRGQLLALELVGTDLHIQPGGAPGQAELRLLGGPEAEDDPGALVREATASRTTIRYRNRAHARGRRARIELVLPPGARLEIHLDGGRLACEGAGPLQLWLANGSAEILGTQGAIDLEARSSRLRIEGTSGALLARTMATNIELLGMSGPVDLTASDAEVSIEGASAAVTLDAPRSRVQVRGVAGAVDIAASEGRIEVGGVQGSLRVRARHCPVQVEAVSGPLDIDAERGRVRVNEAAAGVKLAARDAVVELEGIGPLDATLLRGSLRIEGARGRVSVQAEGADVRAEASASSSLAIEVKRADVLLALAGKPSRAAFRARRGRIVADPELGLEVKSAGTDASATSGTGAGAESMAVSVEDGSIRLTE